MLTSEKKTTIMIENLLITKKKKMITKLCLANEYVPNNYLENQMQSVLNPLIISQHLMFQSKYLIRDNFITPNGRLYNFAGLLVVIILITSQYYGMKAFIEKGYSSGSFDLAPILQNMTCAVCVICIFTDNVLSADNNVNLILCIQAARKSFRYCQSRMDSITLLTRVLIGVLSFLTIGSVIVATNVMKWNLSIVLSCLIYFYFDAAIIYSYAVLMLITKNFEMWLEEMRIRNSRSRFTDTTDYKLISKHWYEMEDSYKNLAKTCYLSQKTLSVSISTYISRMFLTTLTMLQSVIQFEKKSINLTHILISAMFLSLYIVKEMILLCMISTRCQRLYGVLNLIYKESAACKKSTSKDQRKVSKNVTRIHRLYHKLNPCKMFVVDATLPLKFAQLVTTYLIVLLQFAYLKS